MAECVSDAAKSVRRAAMVLSHLSASPSIKGTTDCSAETGSPLDHERASVSFDVRALTYFLDGGEENTNIKELAAAHIENDPRLRDDNRFDMTLPELRERTMEKICATVAMWNDTAKGKRASVPRSAKAAGDNDDFGKKIADAFWTLMALYDPSWGTRIGVHYGLFRSAIAGQGTPEQQEKYLNDIQTLKIIGCFAMTELGHGSYIRGFETTATYDKKTQEFIINSPTETSTKWWIGGAAHTATHAVVFARLIIDSTDFGIHSFVVPIRNTADGRPLPGITIGDCGAKMGRNGIDNGFLQFSQVRIPRDNMLMKWAQVAPDGTYTKPPKPQLSYGALIGGRVGMIRESSDYVKVALTIAVRYSAIRRQFPDPSAKPPRERAVLDYQTHQWRLMPLLAGAYAYHFAGMVMAKTFDKVEGELQRGDISGVKALHATSAGLKAAATWWANDAIEQCRQCLGGHGYSSYNNLASILQDFAVMCTWEGDNTVLSQQTARYLLGSLRKGREHTGFMAYLNRDAAVDTGDTAAAGWLDAAVAAGRLDDDDVQLAIWRRVALGVITAAAWRLEDETARCDGNREEAWNRCLVDLVNCSRAHCLYYTLHCFVEAIASAPEGLRGILKKLSDLFCWSMLIKNGDLMTLLIEDGVLTKQSAVAIRTAARELCAVVRREAVPLVDAFNLPDFVLRSPLGRYDGNIYSAYLETVKRTPGAMDPAPYYERLIKPLVHKQ